MEFLLVNTRSKYIKPESVKGKYGTYRLEGLSAVGLDCVTCTRLFR
jgi:hypothetical protein